ncbi:hypothetical protein D3C71_1943170 [compost metagenome]
MPHMVDGERDVVADDVPNFMDILFEKVQPLVGKVQSAERVPDIVGVIDRISGPPLLHGARGAATGVNAIAFQ